MTTALRLAVLRRERPLHAGPGLCQAMRAEPARHIVSSLRRELALRLGSSELGAFSRAFRAWTGSSPRAYRRRAGLAAGARSR